MTCVGRDIMDRNIYPLLVRTLSGSAPMENSIEKYVLIGRKRRRIELSSNLEIPFLGSNPEDRKKKHAF